MATSTMVRMDGFFDKEYCERCHGSLEVRTTSWFNEETICLTCSRWEDEIIEERSESKSRLEAIGHVPDTPFDVNWGTEPENE